MITEMSEIPPRSRTRERFASRPASSRSHSFPAFTLLELLLVITIIGILSATLVIDFAGVKERQELSLIADQSVAMMQQARGEVNGGKVRRETMEDGTEVTTFLCEGAYFEEGIGPEFARGDYVDDVCSGFEAEVYGMPVGRAFVSSITVDEAPVEKLWALYSPPEGDVVFYDESGNQITGEVTVHFDHSNDVDLDLSITISSVTNLTTLSLGADEE